MDCIFCKIRKGEIPSEKVYEDDKMMIIKDIDPKAKRHYLCIPKNHFKLLSEMNEEDAAQLAHCFKTIPTLADKLGLDRAENGMEPRLKKKLPLKFLLIFFCAQSDFFRVFSREKSLFFWRNLKKCL